MLEARTAEQLQRALRQELPLYASIGLAVDSLGETVQGSVPLSEHNRNHLGTMHAAALWAAAESIGGLAYFSRAEEIGSCWIAVREVTIRFLRTATTDIRARARFGDAQVQAIRRELQGSDKADYTLHVELIDAADTVVATAVGQYVLRRTTTAT